MPLSEHRGCTLGEALKDARGAAIDSAGFQELILTHDPLSRTGQRNRQSQQQRAGRFRGPAATRTQRNLASAHQSTRQPAAVPRPMSLQSVRDFFAVRQLDIPIIELEVSTATVALAAEAHGVEPGRIAKTLAFRINGSQAILLVARGDARIDNRKFKDIFGKGRMLPPG